MARCAACGAELPPAAQFCDECGTPTAASTPAAPLTAAQSRKDVTIVFADLAGSTSLAERMDPESVRSVMDGYYTAIRHVVEDRRGRVVKFIGDGVMAVFGVPETSEDDARRALEAALAMHVAFGESLAQVAADRGVTMSLRVGVNTGEVIVSAGDDDVVGDSVNVAARLEHAAEHGSVLVGETTWRLARGYARFGEVQTLMVAGKTEPVRAYRLESIEDTSTDTGPEFVGRARELDQLQIAFDDVVATGAARLVTLLGSPGVGKTRLATEFLQAVDERATVLVARCAPEAAATLAPVAELLRAATSVTDTSDPASVLQSLGALVPNDEPDRDRIVASAAALLGAAPSGTPEETLWAVRRLLEVAARTGPVVVMIDDLHWAEPMLLDLVDHLAEWTRAPVMLLIVARPELRDVRASMVDSGRYVVIALEGLDGESTARLACDLLATDALPAGLLDRLPESTGGNPLFLRELLRMLVDDDVLRSEHGTWQLSVAPEAIDVPPTIQSLLAARLDRLPPDEQVLLEHASIAGKEFPVGALYELAPSGRPKSATDALLESLRRKELIEPDGTYWIDEPIYRFHHVLIRDAAYRRVLRQTRADLHEHLARWLEHKLGALVAEHGELVGHHLEQSYTQRRELGALDAHGRDIGREAAAHLYTAADRSLDREDLPAAAALAARALRCLPFDDPTRSDVLLVRCDALLMMGEATVAADAVAELARLSAPSPRLAAWCACFTAQLTTMTDPSQLRDSEQRVAAVATELERLGDTRGAAKAHTVHATTLARLGRFADVESALDRALTRAREAGDRRFATAALAAAPTAQVWGPNPVPRAGGRCLDVVRLLRITAGSPAVEATSQRCQGVLEAFRGRADPARRLVASARGTLEELGLAHGLLETEMFAGVVELVSGELDAARQHLRVAHDGLQALGLDADAARAAALLARASFDLGDTAEAADYAAEAKRLAGDDLQSGIAWRGVQAEIDARAGRHGEALALAQEAVAIAAGTDALVHHADACLALAAVRRAAGDERGAEQAARDAADLYERKGATALVAGARARFGGGTTARPTPSTAVGREPSNQCTELFRRWTELFEAHDWDAMRPLVADDFVFNDPRRVVGMREQTRTAAAETVRAQEGLGVQRLATTVVATRGDRLALLMVSAEEGSGDLFATANHLLVATTAEARLWSMTVFEFDDLDAALDELDARYLDGEGAEYADILRAVLTSNRAYNRRDWGALRSYYAPGSVSIDHRLAGQGTLAGVAAQVDLAQAWSNMVPDVRMTIEAIHAVSERAVVYSVTGSGGEVAGGPVELAFHVLERRDDDHRITAMELFSEEMLADALSAFAGESRALTLDNLCLRMVARSDEHTKRGDWEGLGRTYADDIVFEDRRPGMRTFTTGRDASLVNVRAVHDSGTFEMVTTPIAIRGERCALFRAQFVSAAYEIDLLVLQELNEHAFVQAMVVFDLDDLDGAFAELDARYVAGEAAPHADVYRTCARMADLHNVRDWDGTLVLWADDLVFVDHRPGGFGRLEDRREYLRLVRGLHDLAPDTIVRRLVIHRLDAHGCVALVRNAGTSVDGGAIEIVFEFVLVVRDDRIVRIEQFPAHALDDALRRFDELGPAPAPLLDNLCVRTMNRVYELADRGDWDGLAALVTSDHSLTDMRPGVRSVATTRDEFVLNFRAIRDLGRSEYDNTCIAVRGDRLALFRTVFTTPSFEASALTMHEVDETGHCVAGWAYDVDDLDGAFADLDARYLAGEAAAYAEVYRTCVRMADLYNVRDWDGMLALWSDDLVVVDHRPGSFGRTEDRHEYLRFVRSFFDLAPDSMVRRLVIHRLDAHGYVVLVRNAGTSVDGGAVENVFLFVIIVRDGRITNLEQFPDYSVAEALDRFDQLGPAPAPMLDNLCLRVLRRNNELSATEDWVEQFRQFADDAVLDDRRAGLRGVVIGREAMLTNARTVRATGRFDVVDTPLAVRGERYAMFHRRFASAMYEAEMSIVNEVDEHGVVQAMVIFDVDDLDGAFGELDARYLAGEAASNADAYRPIVAFRERYNARDWDALEVLLDDNFVGVDHRAAGWGTVEGRNQLVELMRGLVDLAPDTTGYHAAIYELDGHGAVGLMRGTGVSVEDSGFERLFLMTILVRAGRIARIEFFPPHALDEARARFRELGSSGAPVLDNLAVRNQRRLNSLGEADDQDGLAASVAPDMQLIDMRAAMRTVTSGREAYLRNFPAMRELGFVNRVVDPLAVRGDRLALFRQLYSGDDFEAGGLTVNEVDEEGVCLAIVVFDLDDLEGALAELDSRYLAGDGAPFANILRLTSASNDAFNRRDWSALRAFYSPTLEVVDHRTAHFGMYEGRDDLFGDIPAMIEPSPDLRTTTVAIYPDHHGTVVLVHSTATTPDGGLIEGMMIGVSVVQDGVITRLEYFPENALDVARARLAELAPDRRRAVPSNRAHAVARANTDAMVRHDAAAFNARFAPEYRIDDRRPGIRLESEGVESSTEAVLRENTYIEDTLLATRGERLALHRSVTRGQTRGGFEWEIQSVWIVEINDEGLVTETVVFDVDDLDGAMAELDARYLAGEGASGRETVVPSNRADAASRAALDAVAHQDAAAFNAVMTPDARRDDRRSGVRYEGAAVQSTTWATVRESTGVEYRLIATRGDRLALNTVTVRGQTKDGFEWEIETLSVLEINDDGLISDTVLFDVDDVDSAMAELDARYLAGEGAPFALTPNLAHEMMRATTDALVRRDRAALERTHAPEFHTDDRRSGVRIATVGLDPNLKDVVRECTGAEATPIATRGERLVLYHNVARGETTAGFAWEIENLAVMELNRDGLIAETVLFDAADLDSAMAELEARHLASEGALVALATGVPANRAHVAMCRSVDALTRRDTPAYRAIHAPGIHHDDRRAGFRLRTEGIEPSSAGALREGTGADLALLATRGVRLALHRTVMRGRTREDFEWEVETLSVTEIDGDDLIVESILFDVADADAAMAELDARYLAGEGAEFEPIIRSNMALVDAFNRRDWDALRAVHAPSATILDHRAAVTGSFSNPDELVRVVAAMIDGVPDARMTVVAMYPERHGSVALIHGTSTTEDGGEMESAFVAVSLVERGMITRGEYFADESLADARARLAELVRY